MDTKKLRQKILDLAIHGKLVPQDPNDEPASVLLERIRKEKEQLIKQGKIKAPKKSKSSSDTSHYQKEGPWELPEGWCWSTLGKVCSKVVDGDHNPPPSERTPTEYLMISSKNVLDNTLDELKDVRYLSKPVFEECNKRTSLERGDILLTTVGTLGRSCIYDGSRKIVLQRSVSVMTPKISSDYVKCFFDSGYFQRYIENNARGTAQKGFYLNLLEATYLPIPPLNEQHLIVNKASSLLSELNRIEIEKDVLHNRINKAKNRILDLAIHGKLVPQDPSDEPAIELLKRINPDFKPSDNLHYVDRLPAGWAEFPLYAICEILDSRRKPVNSKEREKRVEKTKTLYPYYGATGQVGLIDNYILEGDYLLLGEDGAPFLDRYAKKAYSVSGKIWVNNHAHILKPRINPTYMMYYLNAIQYRPYVTGTTRLKLTQEVMRNIPVLVPPLPEQERIISRIEKLFRVIDAVQLSK